MSPESVLALAAAPTPAPSAAPAASLGAGGTGGASTGEAGGGSGGASGASTQSMRGGAERPARNVGAETNSTAGSGETQKSAKSARAREPQGHNPAQAPAPSGKDFSQTLAQSLAAPSQTPTPPPAMRAGKPVKSPAGPAADKARKPDPVSAAMAMMRQAAPVAVPPGVAHAVESKRPSAPRPSAAPSAEALAVVAGSDKRTVSPAGTLAQGGKGGHLAQGASGLAASSARSGASTLNNAAALSAGQMAAGTHAAAQAPAASAGGVLSAPVGSSGWTNQLGVQLTWMARQGVQSASLQVSPQHLGPVQVSISVRHGQASVWFGAAQAETRQALTRALPELRAMFAHQGLALTDSGVSHEPPRDSRRPTPAPSGATGEAGAAEAGASGSGAALAGVGLIDTYA